MPQEIEITSPEQLEQFERTGQFRVSIFGSARTQPDDPRYQMTYDFAKALAEKNIGVVTGGGPGIMKAANEGHKAGNDSGKTQSFGLTIRLPWEATHNNSLDVHQHFDKFSNRLDEFMRLSNVVVVMPGGIGTCLELFYTWQLIQVGHICHIPIIPIGATWKQLVDWVRSGLLDTEKTISPQDMNMVCPVLNTDEAMEIIDVSHKQFLEAGENYCFNWERYK
ncbi:MAG TPA: LOG family protein [Candidatus Gracilibacteria bacterium]